MLLFAADCPEKQASGHAEEQITNGACPSGHSPGRLKFRSRDRVFQRVAFDSAIHSADANLAGPSILEKQRESLTKFVEEEVLILICPKLACDPERACDRRASSRRLCEFPPDVDFIETTLQRNPSVRVCQQQAAAARALDVAQFWFG